MSTQLPEIVTPVPGPRSRALAERLARVECPEVTFLDDAPIFWERGLGSNVFDVDGNRYVDLSGGFAVASLGYSHPELADALAAQARELPHAMGDVYPARVKVELLEVLERILPGDLGCAILSGCGCDRHGNPSVLIDVTSTCYDGVKPIPERPEKRACRVSVPACSVANPVHVNYFHSFAKSNCLVSFFPSFSGLDTPVGAPLHRGLPWKRKRPRRRHVHLESLVGASCCHGVAHEPAHD